MGGMRTKTVYRTDPQGNVVTQRVTAKGSSNRDAYSHLGFHAKTLKAYYEVECQGGPWRGAYPKGMVRRIHEEAMAKGEA